MAESPPERISMPVSVEQWRDLAPMETAPGTVSAPASEGEHTINQRIFETSLDLILVVDRRGTLMRVSPSSQATLGYHPDEMVGHSATDFLYPEDLESTRNEMRQARRGRLTRNFDCRYVHKHGRVVTLSWTGVWSEPEQQHFFIGRDITELRKAERRLRRSEARERRAAQALVRVNADLEHQVEQRTAEVIQLQKMESIGRLTAGIAHDFNNLLMVIGGSLDLLGGRLTGDARAQELLQSAMFATDRGASLTQRMLAFARLQALVPRPIDVAGLVRGMSDLLSQSMDPTIIVRTQFPLGLPPAYVDPQQLELALLNLCVNARDAMPEGGTLTLGGKVEHVALYGAGELIPGEYICLIVTDTGSGMDAATLAQAVDPFFTTKMVGQGTGLGLSMVHGLAAQSGGRLVLQSTVGQGTTAELWLRRAATDAESAGESPAPEVPSYQALSVLVVDDDPLVRGSVCAMLEELGHSVDVAASGREALSLIRDQPMLDMVLTDYGMPGMTGLQLVQKLHRLRPQLSVLMMTGFAEMAAKFGREITCLRKPFRMSDLRMALATVTLATESGRSR
jgi:PAS domain S-box-containing protein